MKRAMLEALKSLTGGKSTQKSAEELERLIATAREERAAMAEILMSLQTRSAKLVPMSKSLEQMTEKATTATARLDEIARRLATLDERTR
jgi:K+/H+ antiporter YhaU regulatory subunit KhtT